MLGDPFDFREKLLPELAKRSEALQIATNGQESIVRSQQSGVAPGRLRQAWKHFMRLFTAFPVEESAFTNLVNSFPRKNAYR